VQGAVIVVGGGDTAIDSARRPCGWSEGRRHHLPSSRAEMPATPSEIEAAESEGIKIRYLTAPTKLVEKNGRFPASSACR